MNSLGPGPRWADHSVAREGGAEGLLSRGRGESDPSGFTGGRMAARITRTGSTRERPGPEFTGQPCSLPRSPFDASANQGPARWPLLGRGVGCQSPAPSALLLPLARKARSICPNAIQFCKTSVGWWRTLTLSTRAPPAMACRGRNSSRGSGSSSPTTALQLQSPRLAYPGVDLRDVSDECKRQREGQLTKQRRDQREVDNTDASGSHASSRPACQVAGSSEFASSYPAPTRASLTSASTPSTRCKRGRSASVE